MNEVNQIERPVMTRGANPQAWKPSWKTAPAWAGELCAEVEALTKERDIAVRKLSALSSAHALENLYQAGLDQEREITRLKKERDALAEDAARYRFITGHIVDEGDMGVLERAFEWMQAEFDACIDAAIAKEQRQAGVQ